jgi:hypothetical protein
MKPGTKRFLDLPEWERTHKVEEHPSPTYSDWARLVREYGTRHAEGNCACGHPHDVHAALGVPGQAPADRQPNVVFGRRP